MVPADDGGSPAPVDRPILDLLRERLVTTAQVSDATITDGGHLELRVTLSKSYYPDDVAAATLSVRWYTNDDFKIHYHERRSSEDLHCRWDRHPNPYNTRDHFHPPPNADTPGGDATWPSDYREMLQVVLGEIADRVDELWDAD